MTASHPFRRRDFRHRRAVLLGLAALPALSIAGKFSALAQQPGQSPGATTLRALVEGKQRTEPNKVRDPYRKPLDVIEFLGIRPDSRVVEISPGSAGYWTEILAPYLRDRGLYVAANPAPLSPAAKANVDKFNAEFAAKMAADPASYGKVKVVDFAPERPDLDTPGSADFVLTFRNLHNWIDRGVVELALASFHRTLKKGGILGIKDHRAGTHEPQDPKAKSGYVRQDYAVQMIEKAGFKLVATSEVVANRKDTKDYPAGVWSLPPTYRLKDQDRARYAEIGESDRFLLKFVKP